MTKLNQSVRAQLYKIVFWQLVMIMGLSLVIGLLLGIQKGYSAFLGGLAYWLPTFLFIWRVSAHAGARALSRFMLVFFAGEAVKLFLSAALFVFFVTFLSMNTLYGLLGFIGAIAAFWLVSMTSLLRQGVKS